MKRQGTKQHKLGKNNLQELKKNNFVSDKYQFT